MVQIFYFINIRYLPPILFGLPIDYQSFLAPAFLDANEAMSLKDNLINVTMQEMQKIDKKRKTLKRKPLFADFLRSELEEWIEIDQRFLGSVR